MSFFFSSLVAWLAFQPPKLEPNARWLSDVHYLTLPRCRMRVPAIFIPCQDAQCTILYFHGNAGAVIHEQDNARAISKLTGCNMAVVEYPGYPGSMYQDEEHNTDTFVPTEEATYEAAEAALHWLLDEREIDIRRLIVNGLSLGSGPATHVAHYCAQKNLSLGGLLLVAPIASAFRVFVPRRWYTLPFDIFVNIDKISQIRCKMTIIHGTNDGVVTIDNSYALAERAPVELLVPPPLYIQGANHNDITRNFRDQWHKHVQAFIEVVLKDVEEK